MRLIKPDMQKLKLVGFGGDPATAIPSILVLGGVNNMHDLVIRGGRVLTGSGEFFGDVAVDGEKVSALGQGLEGRKIVDATGRMVLPGAIDGHVHMRTERPSFCYDDTFESGSVAAAFGGVTTMIDQVQAEPGQSLESELDTRMALADGISSVDFTFHMNIREPAEERLAEVDRIFARGITSFKWFMAIPGWAVPDDFLLRGMFEVAERGGLSVIHAENQGVITELRRRAAAAGQRNMKRFTRNYPASAEASAIALAVAMTEAAGGRSLIFHNTCAEGVAAIRVGKERGVQVYGEACLGWLTHTDDVYRGDQVAALPFLVTPPIRDAGHQAALWRGLRLGDLDIVSTDHAAMRLLPETKARALASESFGLDVEASPEGPATLRDANGNRLMPALPPGGLETRLPLVYSEGVLRDRLSLARWVETCCTVPAEIFGLSEKGKLLPGYDADIVVFDPEATHCYSVNGLHSNTDYSVWDGWNVQGRVEKTILRGQIIVDGDAFVGRSGGGRFVERRA